MLIPHSLETFMRTFFRFEGRILTSISLLPHSFIHSAWYDLDWVGLGFGLDKRNEFVFIADPFNVHIQQFPNRYLPFAIDCCAAHTACVFIEYKVLKMHSYLHLRAWHQIQKKFWKRQRGERHSNTHSIAQGYTIIYQKPLAHGNIFTAFGCNVLRNGFQEWTNISMTTLMPLQWIGCWLFTSLQCRMRKTNKQTNKDHWNRNG